MIRLYFVCMGNYYRSRLAEELALHYASQYGIEITVDSGGLSKIPNPANQGSIAQATLAYLANKSVQPKNSDRIPKKCSIDEVDVADIVVCTDAEEQMALFLKMFPKYQGELIAWQAPDQQYDPWLETPEKIDRNVEDLIKQLLLRA